MMRTKSSKSSLRAVTTRLALGDYADLVSEAEKLGTTPSDMIRKAWAEHQGNQSYEAKLSQLEARLTRRIFEIVAAVAGLTPSQREEAMSEAMTNLRRKS